MLNKSLAVFLVDDSVRAIKIAFSSVGKYYTYKTTDKTIVVGDSVLVKTTRGFQVVNVVKVDVQDSLDFEDVTIDYTWVVQKLDLTSYESTLIREQALQENINHMVFNGKKQQLIEGLKNSNVNIKQLKF